MTPCTLVVLFQYKQVLKPYYWLSVRHVTLTARKKFLFQLVTVYSMIVHTLSVIRVTTSGVRTLKTLNLLTKTYMGDYVDDVPKFKAIAQVGKSLQWVKYYSWFLVFSFVIPNFCSTGGRHGWVIIYTQLWQPAIVIAIVILQLLWITG